MAKRRTERSRERAEAETLPVSGADALQSTEGENGFSHYSVMLRECIEALHIRKDGLYVDCTAGGGGHSEAIVSKLRELGGGKLLAVDQDVDAITAVTKRLAPYEVLTEIHRSNFSEIEQVLGGRQADGVMIDLGISSYQIDTPERGFSYMHDARLDMRMDQSAGTSAYEIVNGTPEQALADIIYRYGEERFSRQIAAAICRRRQAAPIETTLELAGIITDAIPHKYREKGSHPAKRTFQALRIAVNDELNIIEPTIRRAVANLAPGGRIVILTFHSLEDRIVKQTFASLAKGCECPSSFPVCVCGKKPQVKVVTGKPILPSEQELNENSRSHSAKLRVAEKIAE